MTMGIKTRRFARLVVKDSAVSAQVKRKPATYVALQAR